MNQQVYQKENKNSKKSLDKGGIGGGKFFFPPGAISECFTKRWLLKLSQWLGFKTLGMDGGKAH